MRRSPLTYPIRFWAIVLAALLLYQYSNAASADNCKYEKKIEKTLDLDESDSLAITGAAGDLEIVGVAGASEAAIHGRVCASREAWLEQTDIYTASGERAEITADMAETGDNWSFGNTYLLLDMRIEVPNDLPLVVIDSSGDMRLKNVADVNISDSSGDIEVEDALGQVSVDDSSGDIDITGAAGDVTIESDSSGDIVAVDIDGSVRVVSDSSGDIDANRVGDDFIVERDSSGDIDARDIGGDFRVLKDGSGTIRSSGVKGELEIPDKD